MKSYRGWTPTQSFLLPPSPLERLPEGHLAYFVLEVAQALDLSGIEDAIQEKDGRGERPYPPALMVALLRVRRLRGRVLVAPDRAGDLRGRGVPGDRWR